jgi:hypothetical protein
MTGLMVLFITAIGADFMSAEARMPFALGCAEWWLAIVGWIIIYRGKNERVSEVFSPNG